MLVFVIHCISMIYTARGGADMQPIVS